MAVFGCPADKLVPLSMLLYDHSPEYPYNIIRNSESRSLHSYNVIVESFPRIPIIGNSESQFLYLVVDLSG